MKFKELATFFEKIENTPSRLSITRLLADLYKELGKDEIDKTIYLLQGRLGPLYEKSEFGMAEKMITRSIVVALNIEKKLFSKEFQKMGDLGTATEYVKKQIKSLEEEDLSILTVYQDLYKLAASNGDGSQDIKVQILSKLIRQLDPLSCRYLVRIPSGILRLGFSDMTVLDAFSWMLSGDKTFRPQIEKAYHVRPDLGMIGKTLKADGIQGLSYIKPKLFTPILMMRAERLSSSKEILEKIGRSAIEPKYDGFRLQIHYKSHSTKASRDEEVRLYSRNLEDVSYMYPDVIEGVKREVKANEIIFEGEAIGFDPLTGSFLPFQETVQRKRKYGITEKAKEIPLKLFAFELLYFDGKNYLNIPFIQRRKKLAEVIHTTGNTFKDVLLTSPETIIDDEKKLELMFDDAISKGLEGIIAKKLDGIYQPGARGWNWIKFKRSYSSKIEDTIDCLVMGYDLGKGKRTSFGIGAFLAGIYDQKQDKFCSIAKIGTGLSDVEWVKLKSQSSKFKVKKIPTRYLIDKMMECDVWVNPSIIVEIKADEITRSPVHTAGRKMKTSKSGQAYDVDIPGFALRFPRLQRFREDKRPEDATTLLEIQKIFKDLYKK